MLGCGEDALTGLPDSLPDASNVGGDNLAQGTPGITIQSTNLVCGGCTPGTFSGTSPLGVTVDVEYRSGDPNAQTGVVVYVDPLTGPPTATPVINERVDGGDVDRRYQGFFTVPLPGIYVVTVQVFDFTNSSQEAPVVDQFVFSDSEQQIITSSPSDLFITTGVSISHVDDTPIDGGELQYDTPYKLNFRVANAGAAPISAPFDVAFYLFTEEAKRNYDQAAIKQAPFGDLAEDRFSRPLARFEVPANTLDRFGDLDESINIQIDSLGDNPLSPGTYFLAVFVDPVASLGEAGAVAEGDDTVNNFRVVNTPLTLALPADLADVTPEMIDVSPDNTERLDFIEVSFRMANIGGTETGKRVPYRIYLSNDDTLDADDTILQEFTTQALQPNSDTLIQNQLFTLPEPIENLDGSRPNVWVFVEVNPENIDPSERVEESPLATSNNIISQEISIREPEPVDINLSLSNMTLNPTSTVIGGTVDITFDVENIGTAPSGEFICRIYVSRDTSFDPGFDQLVAQIEQGIASPAVPITVSWVISFFDGLFFPGDHYIFVTCQSEDPKTTFTNNPLGPSPVITLL